MKTKLVNKDIKNNYTIELLKERGLTTDEIKYFLEVPNDDYLQNPKWLTNIDRAWAMFKNMTVASNESPFTFNLKGITWSGKIYSSISEIVESDNNKAISQAEAEYQRKTAEINAKDEKYQRKISLLDSEHNAMQTEYESVKSALDKNMQRSFKAFQG